MVSLDAAVLARWEYGGKRYEILVDPDLVESFKQDPSSVDMDDFLATDEVWHDAKGGDRPTEEAIEATYRLMQSDWSGPVNIGSEEMVSINQLVDIVAEVAGKPIRRVHKIDANCIGVKARNSNNNLIRKMLEWDYEMTLKEGISRTYEWINEQVKERNNVSSRN